MQLLFSFGSTDRQVQTAQARVSIPAGVGQGAYIDVEVMWDHPFLTDEYSIPGTNLEFPNQSDYNAQTGLCYVCAVRKIPGGIGARVKIVNQEAVACEAILWLIGVAGGLPNVV